MKEAGAVGPETACPAAGLPDEVRLNLEQYLNAGLVREGAPGTFYLFEPAASTLTGRRVARTIIFWLLVIIIPVVILQLSTSGPQGR